MIISANWSISQALLLIFHFLYQWYILPSNEREKEKKHKKNIGMEQNKELISLLLNSENEEASSRDFIYLFVTPDYILKAAYTFQ